MPDFHKVVKRMLEIFAAFAARILKYVWVFREHQVVYRVNTAFFITLVLEILNIISFLTNVSLLYTLKTSENRRFSVFRVYRSETSGSIGVEYWWKMG